MKSPKVLAMVVILVLAGAFAWEYRANRALRAELEQARALAAAAHPPVAAEKPPAAKVETTAAGESASRPAVAASGHAASPDPAAAEPVPARSAGNLSAGLSPVESLGNAGRATPRTAFATQLWAARVGDIDLEAASLTFGPEARARLEQLAATLPADLRRQYDTPEKLLAFMLAGSPHPVGGMQVLGETQQDADNVTLQTEWQHTDDSVVHHSDVQLHRDADGWKIVIPAGLVNRAADYLARTHPSAPTHG